MYDPQTHGAPHPAYHRLASGDGPHWTAVSICDGTPSADYLALLATAADRREFARGYLSGAVLCAVLLLIEFALLAAGPHPVNAVRLAPPRDHLARHR